MGQDQERPGLEAEQQRARSRLFVGRELEITTFSELLAAGETPRIVYIHGPGGIGKSCLLDRFQALAEQAGLACAHLDARLLPAVPRAVRQAVEQSLESQPPPSGWPQMLALDHVEQWAALDGWLRNELLPDLPANVVLLLAGRNPPSPEWRADPGLSAFLIDFCLPPLTAHETADYLHRRGIAEHQHADIIKFARGRPLALSLAADQSLRAPDRAFDAAAFPDLLQSLVTWLLRDLNEPRHRQALEACASVRRLDKSLLAAMLNRNDARREFEWLARQDFVEQRADGLVVHDLIREIVIRNLRSHDIEYHQNLCRRATWHLLSGIDTATQPIRFQAVADAIYVLRHEPYIQRQFAFGDIDCYPDTPRADEIETLADEVAKLEGRESASWFEYWAERESSELLILRNTTEQAVGLAMFLRLETADTTAEHADPAIAALCRYLRDHAPLRPGETVMLTRFFLAHGTHQARTPVWAQLASQVNGRMFTPGISVFSLVSDLGYDWSDVAEHVNVPLLSGSEYRLGGHRYMISGHDHRREPPVEWAHNSIERILRGGSIPELHPPPVTLLQRSEFTNAVGTALRHFHDDEALSANPLLHAPALRRYTTRRDIDTLRILLRDTNAKLVKSTQASNKAGNLLDLVYFQPGAKQQAAAVELNISERTLRRRLRQTEERLVEALWRLDTQAD